MKFHGVEIKGANVQYIVIPRPTAPIVFKATAVMDYSRFELLCPKARPPAVRTPGGGQTVNLQDEVYIAARTDWGLRKYEFVVIESLRNTEGLEWETVDYDKPETWQNYQKELHEAGFSEREIAHVVQGCMEVNALSEEKLEAARASFLATLIKD